MKVDSTTNSNLPTLKDALSRSQPGDATNSVTSNAQSASTSSPTTTSGSGDASVSLSGLSQHLRSLAASGSADIDTAHVESIKAAIKDGSLTIDSSKIADGVLNTARELLQSKTSSTGN
ncbi:flagellar biosynthesis anti-sigma factor FlgM [Paraburkholderia fungorum]|uniref:Negative regulator of flagellin synthesis n=1 Tax=Paraburkholderia fungorum TaxID=134537 RepID=A0AAW3UZ35_9BURK|nr:flagellar biosynthesis anti-sigma factor FlgM [Paraburkholderia fungorum]KFX62203.1 flagellar biosynthesis anti-sigma factor FlgM [Burkholderia sp. K24]AJZ59679.1 flagellar biosynthesis anti-sigma factor FlgM [Paraburkholderia fungorum]MBB4515981.1 negative regulator of flagellin synthesis FlgM [Paraburkholderia fungorum]MBB5544012.1 negative regulator of flagellin synthesis FlgM [Paraburkholderia fungorum]MBB6203603.1 negative regulator of flagellin synthesis FlgM [Paraburkholderia fungoru